MRKLVTISIIIIAITYINGCYYDKAEVLFPPEPVCDTTNVKYSTDILPILNTYCTPCHAGSATAGNGNRLIDSFPMLQDKALTGRLVFRITRPENDAAKMPRGKPKLDTCTILRIKAWVNKGALKN